MFVPPSRVVIDESSAPASSFTLRIVAALGVFAALVLFVLIVIRLDSDRDKDSMGTRLSAYGRRSGGRPTEKATGLSPRSRSCGVSPSEQRRWPGGGACWQP